MRFFYRLMIGFFCLALCNARIVNAQSAAGYTIENRQYIYEFTDTPTIVRWIKTGEKLRDESPDSAIVLYQQSINHSRGIGYADGLGLAVLNLRSLYNRLGLYDESISLFGE